MFDEKTFKSFVSSLCDDFRVLEFIRCDEETFSAKVQCKLQDRDTRQDECKHFIHKFAALTSTSWVVHARPAAVQRFEFRKLYVCQYSYCYKKKENEDNESGEPKCKASIDFKVKKVNRNTMKNDKLLKIGLNCVIRIDFNHSHIINDSAYGILRCDVDTKKVFLEYFEEGMTPIIAKQYFEMSLIETKGKESELTLAKAQINPTMRQIRYLYDKWRSSYNENRSKNDALDNNILSQSTLEPHSSTTAQLNASSANEGLTENPTKTSHNEADSLQNYKTHIRDLRKQFSRIANILDVCYSPSNAVTLEKFINTLDKIKTTTQAEKFALDNTHCDQNSITTRINIPKNSCDTTRQSRNSEENLLFRPKTFL